MTQGTPNALASAKSPSILGGTEYTKSLSARRNSAKLPLSLNCPPWTQPAIRSPTLRPVFAGDEPMATTAPEKSHPMMAFEGSSRQRASSLRDSIRPDVSGPSQLLSRESSYCARHLIVSWRKSGRETHLSCVVHLDKHVVRLEHRQGDFADRGGSALNRRQNKSNRRSVMVTETRQNCGTLATHLLSLNDRLHGFWYRCRHELLGV